LNRGAKSVGESILKTSEVYNKVYHYTTWDGLLGILKTRSLWATHYRFLNDYSEVVLFRNKLIEFLLPYVSKEYNKITMESPNAKRRIEEDGGVTRAVEHDAEVFVDSMYRATGDEIYVASLCGEHRDGYVNRNGLLSQWRGYGMGGGLALEFETDGLEKILNREAERYQYRTGCMADVIYSDDEEKLKQELSLKLSDIAEYVKAMFIQMKLNKIEAPDATKAYPAFVQCVSRYKHRGFKEENEVRIVALPSAQSDENLELGKSDGPTLRPEKERKFRERGAQLVPYIELFDSSDIDLPIRRIIVGPHTEKESRAAALRVMMRNADIEVTVSDIPYV
jgi:hypothetical protein